MCLLKKKLWIAFLFIPFFGFGQSSQITSPDEKTSARLIIGQELTLQILQQEIVLADLTISGLTGSVGMPLVERDKRVRVKNATVDRWISPEIAEKNARIRDQYNELTVSLSKSWKLELRAYDNGVAYRFVCLDQTDLTIYEEPLSIALPPGDSLLGMPERSFRTSYENPYIRIPLSSGETDQLFSLPMLVMKPNGTRVWIGESGLQHYPNLFLTRDAQGNLHSAFPRKPAGESLEGNRYGHGKVETEEPFMAKVNGPFEFPWRIFAVAEKDVDLLSNQLVYQLAPECRIADPSWIQPGWVILDWWARRNIYGVDFRTGSNTATAKYFIDFCAEYGVRYFLFDDGWSDLLDLKKINPDLDMLEVMAYAKEKGVDIMLWVHWLALRNEMTEALDRFQEWGIAGIKVDFMNRSDQDMVDFYWQVAEECAQREMVVNFHGAYKPAGLRRAYPNVLTREGLIEFEYSGVSDVVDPDHHNLLPYIRNVAGPMDFIPGTMLNATQKHFRPDGDRPEGMGTRAHSIALAVICESPMQMIPDAPNDYYDNDACARFLLNIPTTWDQTVPIDGKIGDFTILARQKGDTWYLAAVNDWIPAEYTVPTTFLPEGSYAVELIRDGINADQRAADHVMETITIQAGDEINMSLAPGGGWIGRIQRVAAR